MTVVDKVLVPGGPLVYNNALPQSVRDQLTDILSDLTVDDIAAAGIATPDDFKSAFAYTAPVTLDFYKDVQWVCDNIAAAKCGK